jgi:hypothetical protein
MVASAAPSPFQLAVRPHSQMANDGCGRKKEKVEEEEEEERKERRHFRWRS